MSEFKKGDRVYVHDSPELNNQRVTIVSGQIGTGKTAYRQIEDKNGRLHAIEVRLLTRTNPNKSTAKKKAAPAKRVTTTKAKPKAKAKPAAATKAKPKAKPMAKAKPKAQTKAAPKTKAKDVKTVCLPLLDEDFQSFQTKEYNKLKEARMKDVKAGKVTLRQLQSIAGKSAHAKYYGK